MCWDKLCRRKSQGGMGFRKLRNFNIALVGKQGWRLITNENSLVSKIYKARYYPNSSFLSATVGKNPSYVWRSIMEAQVLLKKGAVRRVGTGLAVSIQNDPWLPDAQDPYIHTRSEAIEGRKVADLMVTGQVEWDIDLIQDIFEQRDANLILSIPLRPNDVDIWFWNKEKLGGYTVKSAYAMLQENNTEAVSEIDTDTWKKVWSLKLPPKVKNFMWRSLTECLPTKDNLIKKKVAVIQSCPVCNLESETVFHTLVTCQFAELCWNHADVNIDRGGCTSLSQWIGLIINKHDNKKIQAVCMLCWELWRNRNAIVWQQRGEEFDRVVMLAKLTFDHWWSAQDKTFDNFLGFMTQADGHEHWECPMEGRLKVNVDAAIFSDSSRYSFSLVARDHAGRLIEARSSCKQGTIDPTVAEAIAVKEALSWVKDRGGQDTVVETDCLSIVQAIRCSSTTLSYLGRVLEDCKNMLQTLREKNVTLLFVKRSVNKVAHYLARHSSSLADCSWHTETMNRDFISVLRSDLKV